MMWFVYVISFFFKFFKIDHKNDEGRNSMVGHLLSLQKSQPDSYSDVIIKGLMVVRILIPQLFAWW